MPQELLAGAGRAIPAIVDEIGFQPRRNLAERALAGVIRFTAADQAAIRRGALLLARGRWPAELPPRQLVSACGYALEAGADIPTLSRLMLGHLARRMPATGSPAAPAARIAIAA